MKLTFGDPQSIAFKKQYENNKRMQQINEALRKTTIFCPEMSLCEENKRCDGKATYVHSISYDGKTVKLVCNHHCSWRGCEHGHIFYATQEMLVKLGV